MNVLTITPLLVQVLYNSLPPMLESCVEEEGRGAGSPIVIGDAVEFLQALLDMMNDQHLHLEVWEGGREREGGRDGQRSSRE